MTAQIALAGSDLGHVVVLAEFGQVRVQLFDPFLVRLEELRARARGFG